MKQYNYKKLAKYYDIVELEGTGYEEINKFLHKIFKKHKVKTVLDMTCGTGAQTIDLRKKGYKITGSDINKSMLNIAKEKSKGLKIKYHHGDIRKSKLGKFDAVISIFNAIGHLSKKDLEKAVKNISKNLKENGLFIFDIFNLDLMKSGAFKSHKFIDRAITRNNTKFVRFNKNTINYKKGIMRVNQETYIQEGSKKIELHKESWDMQMYSSEQLKTILENNGFKVLKFYSGAGDKFSKKKISIMTVARKVK